MPRWLSTGIIPLVDIQGIVAFLTQVPVELAPISGMWPWVANQPDSAFRLFRYGDLLH
jgi:hypothetical protein